MDTKYVAAGMAPNEFTATLWRDILADAGIEAFLKPTEAATFLLASAVLPVRVMVAKERLEEAKAIIAEVEASPDENRESEG
jgi:hypothetical protein